MTHTFTTPPPLRPLAQFGPPMSVAEVAEAIGMHPNWVRQHFRPLYHLKGGKGYKAFRADVEAFLAVSRVWGTPDGPATITELLAEARAAGYRDGLGLQHGPLADPDPVPHLEERSPP